MTDETVFDGMMDSLVRNANQETLEDFATTNIDEAAALVNIREFALAHKCMVYIRMSMRESGNVSVEFRKKRVKARGRAKTLVVALAMALVAAFNADFTVPEPEPEEKPKRERKRKPKETVEGEEKPKRGRKPKKVVEEEPDVEPNNDWGDENESDGDDDE